MGGNSGQVAGYKYFTGLMIALGNTIEQVVNINPDNRGWIFQSLEEKKLLEAGDVTMNVDKPDIFGGDKQEGGWVGKIDIYTGKSSTPQQNAYLAQHDSELVSAFPNLSYLIYRGLTNDKGFQIVSMSGMMKEVLYRVKRTRIKSDGSRQWYESREDGAIVCEIGSKFEKGEMVIGIPPFDITIYNLQSGWQNNSATNVRHITSVGNSPFLLDYLGPYGYFYYNQGSEMDDYVLNSSVKINRFGKYLCLAEITLSINAREYHHEFSGVYRIISETTTQAPVDPKTITKVFIIEFDAEFDFTIKTYVKGGIVSYESGARNLGGVITLDLGPMWQKNRIYESKHLDINPIHEMREILTGYTAMNKPESDVNDENFMLAADRIWDEGLGISWAIQQKSCKEAIDELLYHIEAGIRVNRQTGQYEIVLFRDDLLNLDDAMHFDESNIKEFSREVANQDELINVLNVKYYDRENIKESSFNVYENGNLMNNGNQEITEAVNFPYFMNRRNAELVANWKLKQLSTPTWKGSFTTGKYEARKLNKYDVIKLSWINAGFVDMPVRIMKISLGDGRDNTVNIDWVEVIPYSSLSYQSINVDPPTSVVLPAQPNLSKVFEMPYFEAVQNFGQTQVDAELANNPDLGYLMIASKRPQNNSLNALLYTNSGAGYIQQNVINYCPTLTLDQNIDYLDTSFAVKNVDSIGNAELGSCLFVDNEVMVYQSFNVMTKVITVKRGALDTLPAKHNLNANAFFYDAYPSYDTTQYVDSEIVNAKSLTTTPSSVLDITAATTLSLEINARAIRPYPPANIKINNSYYLAESQIVNDLVVTWVHRNRLQQTGGSILGWTDATVTKETGVTYSIQLLENNVVLLSQTGITANSYTISKSVLLANKFHKLKVWAVRDGYDSFQIFEHQIFITAPNVTLTTTLYKDHITGTTLPAAAVTTVVDESLSANMKWDGTSISGKATAGSTITIEVKE